jgi:hypothetical protein
MIGIPRVVRVSGIVGEDDVGLYDSVTQSTVPQPASALPQSSLEMESLGPHPRIYLNLNRINGCRSFWSLCAKV